MAKRLAGRRIVVTGGGRGIGAEMAKAKAAEGGRLVIADLDAGIAVDDIVPGGFEELPANRDRHVKILVQPSRATAGAGPRMARNPISACADPADPADHGPSAPAPHREEGMSTSSTFAATDGDAYEQVMGRWSRRLAELFLDFVGEIGGDCLDLGCGTGHLAAAVQRRKPGARVTGVDFSPAYVAHAQARTDVAGAEFQVGDACALTFDDRSFDQVLSLLMLHFVPRAPEAVAEMRRVTRPGGVAAATVWDARGGMVASRMFLDTAAVVDPAADRLRAESYVRPLTRPGELGAAWRMAGFVNISESYLTIRMDFADFEDFWSPYLGGQGPPGVYVAGLDLAARERLKEHVRRAYLDGQPDGPRSYACSAWAVKGRAPG